MTNPADLLHNLLTEWMQKDEKQIYIHRGIHKNGADENFVKHRQAIRLINEIEMLLNSTERREGSKRADENALANLTKVVFAYPHNWQAKPLSAPDNLADHGGLDYLLSIAERLEGLAPEFGIEARQSISDFLVELTSELTSDDSLPRELKLHLRRLIVEAQTCLEEYEITGDFFLQSSLDRLSVAVMRAGKASSNPSKWTRFADKFMYPAATALIGGAPGTILAITATANASSGI